MNNVVRIADTTPEPSAKLKGLIDKLLILRAEIDATLAEFGAVAHPALAATEAHPVALSDRLAGLEHASPIHSATNTGSSFEEDDLVASTDPADEEFFDTGEQFGAEAVAVHEAIVAHEATPTPGITDVSSDDAMTCDDPDEAVHVEALEIDAEVAGEAPPTSASDLLDPPVADAPASDPTEVTGIHPVDDLTRIAGIDASMAEQLNVHGIFGYGQIAGWSAADVAQLSDALGIERRVSKENWIEQAAILAGGGSTAFAGGPVTETITPALAAEDPNLRPYEHMQDALRANAAAQRTEARIISLQEQRLKKASAGSNIPGQRSSRRRGRYAAATLATGLAASLGFVAVMLVDVDEIRARAAASEALRTLIHHTKRQFEPRPEPHDVGTGVDNISPEDASTQWIRDMLWPPGA